LSLNGVVVAAYGRQYRVELSDGVRLLCYPRGKKNELACGDRVTVDRTGSSQGVICSLEPRQTLLHRSDRDQQKLIAANVSQVVIVVATEPPFADELVTRCTIAAESQGIRVLIVLNKCDLVDQVDASATLLTPFERLGYPVVKLSALAKAKLLLPHLAGQTSLLIGQSGMGKSTLINALVPGARAATREISQALNAGKHTTTYARLYHLDETTTLIDSPGLMAFGLHHLSRDDLTYAFRELRPLLGGCRFRDCRHLCEPDCSVLAAYRRGDIDPRRYATFRVLSAALA